MNEFGVNLGRQLCEAWGLDPNQVQRIVIEIDATHRIPAVTVELLANDELASIITEHHELRPRGQTRGEPDSAEPW